MLRNKSFFTLVEIMVATAIIGTMILAIVEFMGSQNRYLKHNKEKKFALLKANQVLNELRTYIEDSGETSGNADTLDRLTNLKPHPLLTIMPMPESTLNDYKVVLSGNIKMKESSTHLSSWQYLRTIQVAPIGIGGTRQITVKIYRGSDFKDFPAGDLQTPLVGIPYPKPIISLITVLPTIGDIDFEAQQVYDYYNIAIENIPGWWVHMGELLPVAQGALSYVDSVNDGMTIRNHWITRLGYGRDKFYAPYLNIVKDSYQSVENAYYYPGKLPGGFGKPEYYVPSLIKCHMQSDIDSPTTAITYINGYQPYFTSELLAISPSAISTAWNQYNPYPYAPADYLNNPMRYPDMKKLYELRDYEAKRAWYHKNIDRNPEKNPGLLEISREDNPDFAKVEDYFTRLGTGEEMPWALLLDELSMNPEKFRNAIFLNLHGELLPMPPVRNFSDPAFSSTGINLKKPAPDTDVNGRYSYFRVVTHPEKIRNHAKNAGGLAGAADETGNIDLQNPFLRVYGFLSDPIGLDSGSAKKWRSSAAATLAGGDNGLKKGRLDDEQEAPITIAIRFHKSKYNGATGDNSEFNAWRDLLTKAVTVMRRDRYISFYEGGGDAANVDAIKDLNNRNVYYGTNYTSAVWGSFLAGSGIDVPTEANEGWSYLNHTLDSADANAAKSISQDGFRKKGLGVEPLGIKYSPYFYLDHSLEGGKTQWDNKFYFHQRVTSKIHYNGSPTLPLPSPTDATTITTLAQYNAALAADKGLNVDYIVGSTSPTVATLVGNNIIKGSGNFAPVITISTDILLSGFSIGRTTNPAGWTPHFLGVTQSASLPTSEPANGASEWFAQIIVGISPAPSATSNGSGVMKFWTGVGYDDTLARYHSFPRRNDLRSLGFVSSTGHDSMLGESSANYWNFALVGPDPVSSKYEMLHLSDKNWVPIAPSLNYPTTKVAWDDTMNWNIPGTIYMQTDAFKTANAAAVNGIMAALVGTGNFLITNTTDTFATTPYIMMTTVLPGESSGLPYAPTKGMVFNNSRITAVLNELDPNDAAVIAAFKNPGPVGTRFFTVNMNTTLSGASCNLPASSMVIPKVGIGENVTLVGGSTYDLNSAFYKPAVGMKVYDASGLNQRTITSIVSYTEPAYAIGVFGSSPTGTMRITLDSAFGAVPATMYLVAVPAIQNSAIGNEYKPAVISNPQKRGLTLYANDLAQLDGYAVSDDPNSSNYVKYGIVVAPAGTNFESDLTKVYRLNKTGGVYSWVLRGSYGRSLRYEAANQYWNRIPCYDRMWAEIEYAFIHTPLQNKWAAKEIIGSDSIFTGDHTIILTLHNTPMSTPNESTAIVNALMTGLTTVNGLSGGLQRAITPATFTNDRRLYELEYIPCAVRTSHKPTGGAAATVANTLDLLSNDKLAKNTARWRIKIPSRTQLSFSLPEEQLSERVRLVGETSSKPITMDAATQTFFGTYAGSVQLKNAFKPLVYETRIGGLTVAEWTGIAGSNLPVVVGTSTDFTGTGSPGSQSIKNGYFLDVSKDIADWTLWNKVNEADPLLFDECRTHNLSRAFSWVVDNMADYPNLIDDVRIPFSEKFQTYGDPRHMPYMDTKDGFAGTNNGYNWYFNFAANTTTSNNWADYTNFAKTKATYTGPFEADIPKLFLWLREGMVNANTLWCSITGYSYYYVGLGNEIGYDSANGFPNSIPVHLKPWGVNASSTGYEQSIIDSVVGIKNRSGTWEARNFIGELFPDWEYSNFTKSDTDAAKLGGGLPTGYSAASSVQYYRFNRENSKYLENATKKGIRRVATTGCTALLNIESTSVAGQKFNHKSQADSNTANIASVKRDMITDAFKITFDPTLYSNRPWIITETGNTPAEWTDYAAWRKTALLVDNKLTPATASNLMDMVLYRDSANRIASGLLEIHDKGATSDRGVRKKALFLINGLSQMNISGANSISTFSVMSLLYGFLRGGSKRFNPNITPGAGTLVTADQEPAFVRQLPKLTIISPKITFPISDPICQIKWNVEWRRWDGKPYWGNNNLATDPDYWKTEYAEPKPTGAIFFRVIFSEAPHSSTNDWRYVVKPDVKTAAGLTYDKLIGDNEGYSGSLQDIVEIDGDEVYTDEDTPGREASLVAADPSPWVYRCDWKIDGLPFKTAFAFRVECHRRQHTIYYIDGAGVEKAHENNATAVSKAKEQRKYMHSHYVYQQGLMIREE